MKEWDDMTNEELVLIYQQTKDNSLFEYFLERNQGLMYNFLGKAILRFKHDMDGIHQCGRVAMWEAMEVFDTTKEAKFSTIYYYYVLKQISIYRRTSHMIRVPGYIMDNWKKYIDNPDGRILSCVSLDESVGYVDDPGVTLIDTIISDEPGPDELLFLKQDKESLEKLLGHLKPREEYVVRLWLGLDIDQPRTLQQCGDIVGVSRERIRQIVAKAIKRLRIYAPQYYDVSKYDPAKNEYHDKPSTQIRNDGNLRKRSK